MTFPAEVPPPNLLVGERVLTQATAIFYNPLERPQNMADERLFKIAEIAIGHPERPPVDEFTVVRVDLQNKDVSFDMVVGNEPALEKFWDGAKIEDIAREKGCRIVRCGVTATPKVEIDIAGLFMDTSSFWSPKRLSQVAIRLTSRGGVEVTNKARHGTVVGANWSGAFSAPSNSSLQTQIPEQRNIRLVYSEKA